MCKPNCEAIEIGERVFIQALIVIKLGEELFIGYALVMDGEITQIRKNNKRR
ncbi:hypothetical protein [Paraburkholderia sp. MPAMCS5]|uniref:hypothetical protein n=1 Tax=Paraburkholderia sp. MPAMCS5 TaxID=3112563 RepID=UPI003FA75116